MTSESARIFGTISDFKVPSIILLFATILTYAVTASAFPSDFYESPSNEMLNEREAVDLTPSHNIERKELYEDYEIKDGKMDNHRRKKFRPDNESHRHHHHRRQNNKTHDEDEEATKSHKKHGKNHKNRERLRLKKERELMEDIARLQSSTRFYYFNEQLPATRLPNTYDSMLNISTKDTLDDKSHVSNRRYIAKKANLWKPMKVRTDNAPFHFHMPILSGNSLRGSNTNFNELEILQEATKYKNPLDFFFLPPSENDRSQTVAASTPAHLPSNLVDAVEAKGVNVIFHHLPLKPF